MASDAGNPDPPFAKVRKGREALQCEQMLRAICFLLHGWCRYTGERKVDGKAPKDKLQSIYFDKFVTLVARIWDELFRRSEAQAREILDEPDVSGNEGGLITFPCPFLEMPGKHGRGRAVYDGKSAPRFITSLLHSLQEEDIRYFQVTTPAKMRNASAGASDLASDPRTTVEPALPITNARAFLGGFTEREIDVLSDMSNALRKLGPEQIRALGTHENARKTLEDIGKEFDYVAHHGLIDKLIGKVEAGEPLTDDAQLLLEYADEACRKAAENRQVYERARDLMEHELTDLELKEAFSACQRSGAEIWAGQEMEGLTKRAKRLRAMARYLRLVGRHLDSRPDRSAPTERQTSDFSQAWNAIKDDGLTGLPRNIADLFEAGEAELRPTVKKALVANLRARKNG